MAGCAVYSATKTFVSFLYQALYVELGDKIDVLDWKPGGVDTNLLEFGDVNVRWIGVSPQSAVKAIWKDVGTE